MDSTHSHTPLADDLLHLGARLAATRAFWHPRPYVDRDPEWTRQEPAIADHLLALDRERLEALHAGAPLSPDAPDALRALFALEQESAPARFDPTTRVPASPRWRWRIPGRKWRQIQAFLGVAADDLARGPVIEWCAGKGHLGRVTSLLVGRPVVSIERSGELAAEGRRLARRAGADTDHRCHDVLQPSDRARLPGTPDHVGMALHACGDLHAALIEWGIERDLAGVVVVPCCYHRTGPVYRPLSTTGATCDPGLDQHDLRLVGWEEIVAPARERRMRRREQTYRAGVDALRRSLHGDDRYRPVEPVPRAWLRGSFEEFARRVLEREGEAVPRRIDGRHWLREGVRHVRRSRALATVRLPFRRLIERWIVLDRARRLEEAGYEVRWGRFCAPEITPRNLMIRARRGSSR